MATTERKRPTDAELEILQAIWELGPSTVRQVHACLALGRDVGQTTVLKLMQIMVDKGLLVRDASVRPQVFRPAQTQARMLKQLTGDMLDRVFNGSPGSLVMHALSARASSVEDRQKIRELLDRLEEEAS